MAGQAGSSPAEHGTTSAGHHGALPHPCPRCTAIAGTLQPPPCAAGTLPGAGGHAPMPHVTGDVPSGRSRPRSPAGEGRRAPRAGDRRVIYGAPCHLAGHKSFHPRPGPVSGALRVSLRRLLLMQPRCAPPPCPRAAC